MLAGGERGGGHRRVVETDPALSDVCVQSAGLVAEESGSDAAELPWWPIRPCAGSGASDRRDRQVLAVCRKRSR